MDDDDKKASTGESSDEDDTTSLLKAILKKLDHLDAIEGRLGDLECQLAGHQAAIARLEKFRELILGSQSGSSKEQDETAAPGNNGGYGVEDSILGKHPSPSINSGAFSRPPPPPLPHGSRGQVHNHEDYGFHPHAKLEFPTFDGKEDPLLWLNRCETFFCGQCTTEDRKVWYASLHMAGTAQLWYYRLELNSSPPSWRCFEQLVHKRFGPPMTESPLGELALLCRTGPVEDYCDKFLTLACHDMDLTESQQVPLFTAGLGHPLKIDVALHKPDTLDDAIMLARAYEQRLNMTGSVPTSSVLTGSGKSVSVEQHYHENV